MIKELFISTMLVASAPTIITAESTKKIAWKEPPTTAWYIGYDTSNNYGAYFRDHESLTSTVFGEADYNDFGAYKLKQKALEKQMINESNDLLQIDVVLMLDLVVKANNLDLAVIDITGQWINTFADVYAQSYSIYESTPIYGQEDIEQTAFYTNWFKMTMGTGQGAINENTKYNNALTGMQNITQDQTKFTDITAQTPFTVDTLTIQTRQNVVQDDHIYYILDYTYYVSLNDIDTTTLQMPLDLFDNLWQSTTGYADYEVEAVYQEVVDIPGLMFMILGMPFAWISQAFNFTIFPGTPYAINISHIFLTIIVALILVVVIKKIIK